MYTMKYSLEREESDHELVIEYGYTPPSKGYRPRGEPPIEPDSPAEIEITSIQESGKEFEVTPEEEEKIEKACWDDLESHLNDYEGD